MAVLLRIDSSSRQEGSHSRALADDVETAWVLAHPDGVVVRRDLAAEPIAPISDAQIAAFFSPPEALTDELRAAAALSDRLLEELFSADAVLISAPIYNFSVPAALKAWIDQIVRIRRTFDFDGAAFTGLAGGRTGYLALAYGAAGYVDGPLAAMDFHGPYLRAIMGFVGITDLHSFHVEATSTDQAAMSRSREAARAAIADAMEPPRAARGGLFQRVFGRTG